MWTYAPIETNNLRTDVWMKLLTVVMSPNPSAQNSKGLNIYFPYIENTPSL